MKRLLSLALVVALVIVLIPGTFAVTNEERREAIAEKLEQLIPEYILNRNIFHNNEQMKQPTFFGVVANPDVYNPVMDDPNTYKSIAAGAFTDIKGDEWYAHLIALGVYCYMINGKPDGSFKGNDPVTIGEWATIFASSIYRQEGLQAAQKRFEPGGSKNWTIGRFGGVKWWLGAYDTISGTMPDTGGFVSNPHPNYGDTPMCRGQVAVSIARYYFSDELSALYGTLEDGGQLKSSFTDMQKINMAFTNNNMDVAMAKNSELTRFDIELDGIKHPERGVSLHFYAAIVLCEQKGIIKGYPDGRSGWNDTVTRAQCLQFLANTAQWDYKTRILGE